MAATATKKTTAADIVTELRALGKDSYKRLLMANHGIQEPVFGVSVASMKTIQRRVKKDYQLALDLYDTGIYDAMYLAGLIADDAKMTKKNLQHWVETGQPGHCTYTVAWVAAGSPHGWEMALKWIDSKENRIAAAGWSTLVSYVAITADEELDIAALKQLLKRVEKTIHKEPDGVRYAMNMFVIGVGSYVKPLSEVAIQTAEKIGRVTCDMGNNSCQVPYAPDYIRKVEARGSIGKKRKTAKC